MDIIELALFIGLILLIFCCFIILCHFRFKEQKEQMEQMKREYPPLTWSVNIGKHQILMESKALAIQLSIPSYYEEQKR